METQSFEYRGYRIVVTHVSPFWQAAIHPIHRNLPTIDCTSAPRSGREGRRRRGPEADQ